MWSLQGSRGAAPLVQERYSKQGTAYRRARQLYAAGFEVTAIQYSIDEPPQPIAVYRFDGIRFVRLPKLGG
jgi:hypothetical protein